MEFINVTQAKKTIGISYLGITNQSAKLEKNFKVHNVLTYSLYLSPSKISGYDVCPESTKECRLGCLNTSGLAKLEDWANMSNIKNARNIKTKVLFQNQDFFMKLLIAEIESAIKKAERINAEFAVRLNCTSDIDWAKIYFNGRNIFEIFPQIMFYDYTKIIRKFVYKADNYDLTFSYTGYNWEKCVKVLNMGYNVAMVFNTEKTEELPMTYKGIKIINGDLSDYRINDAKGVIVGLYWKKIANRVNNNKIKNSVFCMQMNDQNLVFDVLKSIKTEKKSKVA